MPFTLTGAQVRARRLLYHVSQAELARQLGYTRQAIWWWERRCAERLIPSDQATRIDALYPDKRYVCESCGSSLSQPHDSSWRHVTPSPQSGANYLTFA